NPLYPRRERPEQILRRAIEDLPARGADQDHVRALQDGGTVIGLMAADRRHLARIARQTGAVENDRNMADDLAITGLAGADPARGRAHQQSGTALGEHDALKRAHFRYGAAHESDGDESGEAARARRQGAAA